ncbi:MAG: trypsin-like peptidase domain-containing protein [Gemmatimonadota bacterium]|nr:trypsin-like peptidase domain-containing protein [Gemmatimonadota bacterium]
MRHRAGAATGACGYGHRVLVAGGWLLIGIGGCVKENEGAGAESALAASGAQGPLGRAEDPGGAVDPRRRTSVTEAVARVAPTVVTVQTEIVERAPVDPFDLLFGRAPGERISPGIGSGFIVRGDGVIVTNAHVVSGAARIFVALGDGTTYPARLLGADEPNDLAVLKVEARDLPVATLGDSRTLIVGETVIAIGNPFGFVLGSPEPSVTTGVISATGRNLVGQAQDGQMYLDMIQTDAAINPGNSGGPLITVLGEVIGVNSSIYSPTGASVGLGFAIPINRVRRVTEDLLVSGTIRQPWIGIKPDIPAATTPRDLLRSGVVVATVVPGSPAARAGIVPGDVVLRAGERVLRSPYDWEAMRLELRVGEEVSLLVRRGARELSVGVRVADLPEVSAPKVEVLRELELVTLTPVIRADRGVRAERGALIYRISARVSDEIGIEAGDVLLQVNRTPIERAEDVSRAIDYYAGRGPIRLFFERGQRVYTTDFVVR